MNIGSTFVGQEQRKRIIYDIVEHFEHILDVIIYVTRATILIISLSWKREMSLLLFCLDKFSRANFK